MGVRARLLLIALLASLLPAVLALLHVREDRQEDATAAARRLAILAQDRQDDLQQRILATTQLHFGLARSADLAGSDRQACSAFLSEVREAHPQYTGILTILPDGRLFCDSLRSGRELDLNDRAYFRRALATGRGAVLEPVFGRLTGRAVMQVAYPVRAADGALRFVLLASLDLARLPAPGNHAVPDARLLLLDGKGTVLVVSPGEPGGLRPGSSIAGTPLAQFALASREAATRTLAMADGQRHTWARADGRALSAADVTLLVGAPEASITALADRRYWQAAALCGVFAAGLFLALWAVSEWSIRRPIARMTAMTSRMGAGELAARVEPPLPSGELGALAEALNQAAIALQQQRDDIERLDARLLQAQRLEAVGQLTGGVAHDFNNLLTVVLGNADRLAVDLADDPDQRQAAEMIVAAAERGAALTQQLLAFARKQPLTPGVVDVNQRITALTPMLQRTLGEHIQIEIVRGAGLWPAQVDPGQLDNAVLNLCLNARDAMPGGGRLTLETGNASLDRAYAEQCPEVEPGPYTMVAVSDTGVGIAAKDLGRVFEPFYTTKETGKGTGMGLAMVYGFARQSGGHATIYSEPGHGTTVRLYLPRAAGTVPAAEATPPAPVAPAGNETVLVVEDDDTVRLLACRELEVLGYRVIAAANGAEALARIEQGDAVDLLFTDIVMPGGLSGRELADAVQQLRPGLPVLFTSGYTENAIVHHGRLDPGVLLLSKPYRHQDLARAVRSALDAAGGRASTPS
jgi:signal transduction histidine kinase/ActR/RegA family two-component response regulator